MRKLFLFILFLSVFTDIFSQELQKIEIDKSYSNITFGKMAEKLKDQFQIELFFEQKWVENISTPSIDHSLMLPDFLNQLLTSHNLHYIFFQDNIVVMPGIKNLQQTEIKNSNILTIGNPLEKGKNKTAVVHGTITEGKNKMPIPGAQVFCKELSKAVSSNIDGHYNIELPTGEHQIRFTFIGLEDEFRNIVVYGDGELNIELYEESISLNQIDVMAERPEDNFRSTSMGMEKLNIKSIKQLSVLMGETDVIKSMTMLPGVQSTGENASGFNVRGGNIDQNLIQIDNATIFNTSHMLGLFSAFDASIVKDVTLYKSGMPARYGGRIASVMNIDLMKGQNEKIKVNGGIGIINSRLMVEGPINNKLNFIVGGRTTYSDWLLDKTNNYELQQSSANFYDFDLKLDYALNAQNRFSIFAYGSNDHFYYFQNAEYKYGNTIGAFKWNQIYNKNNSGTLSINFSQYNADIADFTVENEEYNLHTAIEQEQLAYHFSTDIIARHKINAGINAMRYHIMPGSSTPYSHKSIAEALSLQNENAFEFAAYLEDEFDILPQLAIIAGLRYSNFLLLGPKNVNSYQPNTPINENSLTSTQAFTNGELVKYHHGAEPRLSLRYELGNASSIKLGYSRNLQYIRQISNSASITPADYWKASDNYIAPLKANQYSFGFFKNLKNNTYETSIEIYYKNIENEVDYKNGGQLILNANLEQALILGKGKAYGAELMLKKSTGSLTGWLAYTYSRSFKKINGQFDEEKINNGNWYKSDYDKPHDLTFFANYKISRRFTFSSNFTYSTGRPATYPEQKYSIGGHQVIAYSDRNKYRLPDYHRLDVAITYEGSLLKKQFWRSSWTFSIYNVYGRDNTFSVFYEKQDPSAKNNYNAYSLHRFAIIGIPVPSFTYNFWF